MSLAYEDGQALLTNFFSPRRTMSLEAAVAAFQPTRRDRQRFGVLAIDEIQSVLTLINSWTTKLWPFGAVIELRHLAICLKNASEENPAIPVWLLTEPFIYALAELQERPQDLRDHAAVVFCRNALAFCLGYYGAVSGFSKLGSRLDMEAWQQGLERRARDYPMHDARHILGDRIPLLKLRSVCNGLLPATAHTIG